MILGTVLVLGPTLVLACLAIWQHWTIMKQNAALDDAARYVNDLQADYAADLKEARESGMALTVKAALKEGFQKGVGYAMLSSTASREREYEHGRG